MINKKLKNRRALNHYTGFKGDQTVAHIMRNITEAYPDIYSLPSHIIGKIMDIANKSYHDGASSQKLDTWAFDSNNDFLFGIRGTDIAIEVRPDDIITISHGQDNDKKEIFKKIA